MLLPVLSSAILNNEISKACYQETQRNGKKHVLFIPGNSCWKLFVNFQGKHPH